MNHEDIVRLHLGSVHHFGYWEAIGEPIDFHNIIHSDHSGPFSHSSVDLGFDLNVAITERGAYNQRNRAQTKEEPILTHREKSILIEFLHQVMYVEETHRELAKDHKAFAEYFLNVHAKYVQIVLKDLYKAYPKSRQ